MLKFSSRVRWIAIISGILLLGLLWYQVFAMTGLLWWNAPASGKRYPRPAPPKIQAPKTDWVDLEAYLGTHPVWQP